MCKLFLDITNLIIIILCIEYLLGVYSDTKIDTSLYQFEPGEKESFFIDPSQNTNQRLIYDKKCQLYQEKIMNPNVQKLGDVFKFNIPFIHSKSGILTDLVIFMIIFFFFSFIYVLFIACIPVIAGICSIIFFIGVILMILAQILILVVFILLLIDYYSGDTNTYYNFLFCRNVNYNGFNRYKNIENLRIDFRKFFIFQILSMILSYITQITSKREKNE